MKACKFIAVPDPRMSTHLWSPSVGYCQTHACYASDGGCDRAMNLELHEALADAYKFISQPASMSTPKGKMPTATYDITHYDELTTKIRSALGM